MQKRSWKIILSGLLFLGSAEAKLSAEEREAQFHRIYKQSNETPTSEDEWQKALSAGESQSYTVQRGDTLWGISETFFGDPQFYPKVWSLNGQDILNPHEINPRLVIHFTEGTLGEPPSMEVKPQMTKADEVSVPAVIEEPQATEPTPAVAANEAGVAEEAETFPRSAALSKPFQPIPKSFPAWIPNPSSSTYYQMEIQPRQIPSTDPETYLEAYLEEDEIPEVGVVAETESGLKAAGEQSYLYVRMDQPAQTNARYLIVKPNGTIKDPESGRKAIQIMVQGEVQILEVVNTNENLYRAKVLRIVNQVSLGAKLVAGDLPLMNAKEESAPVSTPTKIVGGAYSSERQLFGQHDIVFLNRGSGSGLSPGQVLPVYKKHVLRNKNTEAFENPLAIGRLKILKLTPNFAAAMVTQSIEEIKVGDSTTSINNWENEVEKPQAASAEEAPSKIDESEADTLVE